jgi:glycosyltransferase involved in cell wall biosynthesis
MTVVVDGIIYQLQSKGGISRLYSEVLPRMCNLDDLLYITLLSEGRLRQALPRHPRIAHRPIPSVDRYLCPGRVWKPIVQRAKRLVRKLWTGRGNGKIWHSTYYTLPEKWDGTCIVTVPDMIHERFEGLFNDPASERFREEKRRCVLSADAVICISEITRQDVQRFYGINAVRIQVVPLAHSRVFRFLEKIDYSPKLPTARPFLLYIGGRYRYKNFDGLLSAYGGWPGRKEVDLVVVGRHWSADEGQSLVQLEIADRVHLLTNVDDESLCHLYNRAAAFVYPSLYEGFGIPLLEAMACGCPLVASCIPSTIEVARECAIYFEPTEVEDFRAAFDVVLSEGRDSERVRAGFEQVKRYSWDKTAKQMLDVYHALYKGTNASHPT